MSEESHTRYATFEEFYEALDAERHISERLSEHHGVRDQVRGSLHKLYERLQSDTEFEKQLAESPQDTALSFFQGEIAQYSLSDDDLEMVAGGKITQDSTLGYDVGYAVGSAVEFVVGLFD